MNDFYILKKRVDKSVLCQGFTIPQVFQDDFYQKIGFELRHGETTTVKVSMNGAEYDIKVVNQGFDREKYAEHKDVLQLRYDGNRAFLEALRSAFPETWDKLTAHYAETGSYKGFKDKDGEEYLSIYAVNGSMLFECITREEYAQGTAEIKGMSETAFEAGTDENARIELVPGIRKIRHLSRAIGNDLKVLYGYRCQICGQLIGEKYGSKLIHAHHIDYFTKSLNNSTENILILCPNHHGIIHDTNPEFDKKELLFKYPNGYKEGLMLNRHIGKSK